MKITEVSYGATFNTGNFNSLRLDATATVEEGDDEDKVMEALRKFVHKQAELSG